MCNGIWREQQLLKMSQGFGKALFLCGGRLLACSKKNSQQLAIYCFRHTYTVRDLSRSMKCLDSFSNPSSNVTESKKPFSSTGHSSDQIPFIKAASKPEHLIKKPFVETIPNSELKEIAKKAEECWQEMGHEKAIKYLREALSGLPPRQDTTSQPGILYDVSVSKLKEQLATMYFYLGDVSKALPLFEELREEFYSFRNETVCVADETIPAVERDTFANVSTNMVECYLAIGKKNEAEDLIQETLNLCLKTNGLVEASPLIERMAYLALENSKDTKLGLSQKMDILTDAIELIAKGLAQTPENCDLLYVKSLIYEELSRILPISRLQEKEDYLRKAIEGYEALLKTDPTNYHAELNAGDCYSKLGDDLEALSFYNRFMDHFELFIKDCTSKGKNIDYFAVYVDIMVKIGIAYMKAKDIQMATSQLTFAIEFIDKCLSKNPANADILKKYKAAALNKRGWCHYKNNEWWKSVDDNTEAINIDNTFFPAFRDRCESYECLGKMDLAKEDRTMCEYLKRKYALDTLF